LAVMMNWAHTLFIKIQQKTKFLSYLNTWKKKNLACFTLIYLDNMKLGLLLLHHQYYYAGHVLGWLMWPFQGIQFQGKGCMFTVYCRMQWQLQSEVLF
jgi:hypothetical protein